jgi:hypothetical protein
MRDFRGRTFCITSERGAGRYYCDRENGCRAGEILASKTGTVMAAE